MKASDIVIVGPTLEDALDILVNGPKQIPVQTAEAVFDKMTEAKSWQKGILLCGSMCMATALKLAFQLATLPLTTPSRKG